MSQLMVKAAQECVSQLGADWEQIEIKLDGDFQGAKDEWHARLLERGFYGFQSTIMVDVFKGFTFNAAVENASAALDRGDLRYAKFHGREIKVCGAQLGLRQSVE